MITGHRVKPPSYAGSLFLLAFTDLAFRLLGFARSVALARKLAGRQDCPITDPIEAERVNHRVRMAAVFYPGRALCLEQSLALFILLRRRGIGAELRLGVQPYPFNAHAWVELNGQPVNESKETIRQFVPIQDFAV